MIIVGRGVIVGAKRLLTNSNFEKAAMGHLYTSSAHLLFYMNASFGLLSRELAKYSETMTGVC